MEKDDGIADDYTRFLYLLDSASLLLLLRALLYFLNETQAPERERVNILQDDSVYFSDDGTFMLMTSKQQYLGRTEFLSPLLFSLKLTAEYFLREKKK